MRVLIVSLVMSGFLGLTHIAGARSDWGADQEPTEADLEVVISDGIPELTAGTLATYELAVTNHSSIAVPSPVRVTSAVPSGLKIQGASPGCVIGKKKIRCRTDAEIDPEGSAVFEITGYVPATYRPRYLSVRAEIVSSPLADPELANNVSSDSDRIESVLSTKEARLVELVNRDRSAGNLAVLEVAPRLARYARRHSRVMGRSRELFHSSDKQMLEYCDKGGPGSGSCSLVGENAGHTSRFGSMHGAFMGSAGHRHNILHPSFTHIGIGVARRHGAWWVTEIFLEVPDG